MNGIAPPKDGDGVSILAPPNAPLRGHVTGRSREALTIELEPTPIRRPFRFTPGSEVEVEWTHALGVMQLKAQVGSTREEPRPTLELRLVGDAEPIQLRRHERLPVELEVSAWTLAQPTRRLIGSTVDLSVAGALLRLPDLTPLTSTLEVWIGLPGKALHASAGVRWRGEPDQVGVEFERIAPDEQARLVDYLRPLG